MSDLKGIGIYGSEVRDAIKGALSSSMSNTKVDAGIMNAVMGGFTKTVGSGEEAELAAGAFVDKVQRKLGRNSSIISALADKNSEMHDFLKATLGYPDKFPAGRDRYVERFLECVAFEAGEVANKKKRRH
jgi:hypothetical protein